MKFYQIARVVLLCLMCCLVLSACVLDGSSGDPSVDLFSKPTASVGTTSAKPTEPTTKPTIPTEPTTEPTIPTEPTTKPSIPTEPTTKPTIPTEPTTKPTIPTEPTTKPSMPTEPSLATTKPTEPTHVHGYTSEITKEPSCTEEGVKTFTCSCGNNYIEAVDKLSHTYTANITPPTCTEAGYTTYTCKCGDSYKADEKPALGHSWGKWSVMQAATEEAPGKEARVCSECDAKEERVIPQLAHTHKYTNVVTAPTCTEAGYTTYTCKCGDSYKANEKPALGHSYSSVVTKEPSYTEEGILTYTCSCGDSYTEAIPKLTRPTVPTVPFQAQGLKALQESPNADALVAAYHKIAQGVENCWEEILLQDANHSITIDELQQVYGCYRNDYPQHFWLGNQYSYSYSGSSVVAIYPQYMMSGQVLADAKQAVEARVQQLLALLNEDMSQYEMELIIHDALVNDCRYVDGVNAHSLYGALVEGKAVCEGYAEAFQYLMHRIGINCIQISGYAGEAHAWNAVQIGTSWYYTDVTWDDPVMSGGQNHLGHGYFNLTREQMDEDHLAYEEYIPLPEAVDTEFNYYVYNGMAAEHFDLQQVVDWLKASDEVSFYVAGDVDAYIQQLLNNVEQIVRLTGKNDCTGYSYMVSHREVTFTLIR